MSIKVLRPGLLTTIQDLGRVGYQKYGVIVSGAMDAYALRMANLLVGNSETMGALEITMAGPALEVQQDTLIAVTGGHLSPSIGNYQLPSWRPVFVKKGSVIRFGKCISGCRAYLAFAGGFNIEKVMESQSTYLRAEIGGYKGRTLKEGDILSLNNQTSPLADHFTALFSRDTKKSFYAPAWRVRTSIQPQKKETVIRVLTGTHYTQFDSDSQEQFFTKTFTISPQSDRMGYRLQGPELKLDETFEVLSEAVALGTVQVPADGNPIILLADRQTTGGYPRMGQVINVDIPLLAQLKPGDTLSFKKISLMEAEELYIGREKELNDVRVGMLVKRHEKTP
ncbi:biotin-dependent carboxyltransferase family protein [Alkalihalophilus sp. As8PL]|uniref:Biotin-dependent carboxyltransferase family protein n=1 Tax=Alkalihalophilus sp. As8PL TaxID=3237103 RepID=A0AB39BXX7_9BACI